MTSTGPEDSSHVDAGEGQDPPTDIDAIQADIAQTRAELAETVEQVAGHLNPKVQAKHATDSAKQSVADTAAQVKAAAPAPVQRGMTTVGEKAGPPLSRANAAVAPHRAQIAAGAAAAVVVVLVVRRRRNRS